MCHNPGLPLLHQLLNSPLVVSVVSAGSKKLVGTASLDLKPFAEGLDRVQSQELHLEPELADGDALASDLMPEASISVVVLPHFLAIFQAFLPLNTNLRKFFTFGI